MQAATRRFCLMKPSASVGTRWIVLAVSTLMLVMLALAARADAFVYWANTANTIARANLDGSGVNENFIRAYHPWGVAVNGQHIYWGNGDTSAAHQVGRANLDGSGVNQRIACLCALGIGFPVIGVAVNSSSIYFAVEFGAPTAQTKSSLPASPAGTTPLRN